MAYVYNALALPGSYDFRVRNIGDDYPDGILEADAFASEPLAPGRLVNANLESSADQDLSRYDVPPGATGALTFTVSGLSPAPKIDVYYGPGGSPPSSSILATGAGSVTIASPVTGHYYARPRWTGATGAYQIVATRSGCTNCNEDGTYASPRPLATARGGMVINRLDEGAESPGLDTWQDCRDGTSCDWYEVDLAENQRVTATVYGVFDWLCDIEVAVYLPPEAAAYGDAQTEWVFDGVPGQTMCNYPRSTRGSRVPLHSHSLARSARAHLGRRGRPWEAPVSLTGAERGGARRRHATPLPSHRWHRCWTSSRDRRAARRAPYATQFGTKRRLWG